MNTYDTERSYLERFSESFGHTQGGESFLVILLVVLGVVLMLLFIRRLIQENLIDREGKRVFNDLCRAHALTRKERRLLLAYARTLALRNRAALFVRPSLFEDPAARAEQMKGIAKKLNLDPDAIGALDAGLRKKLFAEYHSDGKLRGQTDKVRQEQAL
jgi:hypothetical protein